VRARGSASWLFAMRSPVSAIAAMSTPSCARCSQAALLGHADQNLYAAKNAGRNRVVYDLA